MPTDEILTLEIEPPYIGSAVSPTVDIDETTDDITVTITDFRGEHSYTVEKTDQAIEDAEQAAQNANDTAQTVAQGWTNKLAEINGTLAQQREQMGSAAAAESQRITAENARVAAENARVQEWDELNTDATAATSAANDATTRANNTITGITQTANQIFAQAGQATIDANAAAQSATDAATLATNKAGLANTAAQNADTATTAANNAATTATTAAEQADTAREAIQDDLAPITFIQKDEIDSVYGVFSIIANTAHSSNNDRISFPFTNGETVCVQALSASGNLYTGILMYGSSSTIATHSILSSIKTDGNWYSTRLTEDLDSFGIYIAAKSADDTITWRIRKLSSPLFNIEDYTIFTGAPYCYFEPVGNNGGIWFRMFSQIFLRGKLSNTTNWADVLPDNHDTTPQGVSDCIRIPHNYVFAFNHLTSEYVIVEMTALKYDTHIPILWAGTQNNVEGIIGGIGYHLYANYLASNISKISTKAKALEYAAIINDSAETEQFMYFTDPHFMSSSNKCDFEATVNQHLDVLYAYADTTSIDFVMCGGDWLNSSDNPTYAKYKLGLLYGYSKRFRKYYGLVGNHDTNYQGTDAEGNTNSGRLDNAEIKNAMFGGEHNNYYSFDGNSTKFYVFDSGTDTENNVMTAYKWEQVDWFASALLNDDKPHSAVSIHIWYTNFNDATADTISAFATNIASVIAAYNGRTTVTLNSITYDFSTCDGLIEFVICGHTHFDKSGTTANIPVINTLNAINSNKVSFDLVYVDYNNRKIKTVRIGTGSNRTFDLAAI